jgi:hypothetical protein
MKSTMVMLVDCELTLPSFHIPFVCVLDLEHFQGKPLICEYQFRLIIMRTIGASYSQGSPVFIHYTVMITKRGIVISFSCFFTRNEQKVSSLIVKYLSLLMVPSERDHQELSNEWEYHWFVQF